MGKKILIILVVLVSLGLALSFFNQLFESLRAEKRLDDETGKLAQLQKQSNELKRRLFEVDSLSFIESQARDKLNLTRPGESLVIISPALIDQALHGPTNQQLPTLPNWQGWLKLFFN
ncbi:septum formation initiator family protein [Candidatus Daviesbacteria bacterium]|nr:septum formation initiator family protein [Candidatus Daviesbacteria bacterium]